LTLRSRALHHSDETDRIIAAGIEVRRALGPGFLEHIKELSDLNSQLTIPAGNQLLVAQAGSGNKVYAPGTVGTGNAVKIDFDPSTISAASCDPTKSGESVKIYDIDTPVYTAMGGSIPPTCTLPQGTIFTTDGDYHLLASGQYVDTKFDALPQLCNGLTSGYATSWPLIFYAKTN
jgi:hypothetical protein